MDLYYPGATWRGPTPNHGGSDVESRGLVLHIAEGTFEGTIAWQRDGASQVSSEFVISADGRVAQMMAANLTAWTQRAGNGHWDAVEFEGHTPNPLTADQVEACARLYAWGHQVRGWPLQIAIAPSGQGLGHHSMGAEAGVDWGHSDCPGPAIVAQKPAIIARAAALAAERQDPSMPYLLVRDNVTGAILACFSTGSVRWLGPDEYTYLAGAGVPQISAGSADEIARLHAARADK